MLYLRLLRANQWVKNLLIFLPLFFSGLFLHVDLLIRSGLGFLAFCLAASAVYIFNDLRDVEYDRQHPQKKFRPLASNEVSANKAKVFILLLIILLLVVCYFIGSLFFFGVTVLYLILNGLYSRYIKHLPIYDIVFLASFYLIRVLAGGVVTNIRVSGWLFICIFFFALFLASGKRRAELIYNSISRPVLALYNEKFLDFMVALNIAFGFFTYALYVISLQKPYWSISVFVTSILVFQVMYEVFVKHKGEAPEKIFFKNPHVIGLLFLWLIINIITLYVI